MENKYLVAEATCGYDSLIFFVNVPNIISTIEYRVGIAREIQNTDSAVVSISYTTKIFAFEFGGDLKKWIKLTRGSSFELENYFISDSFPGIGWDAPVRMFNPEMTVGCCGGVSWNGTPNHGDTPFSTAVIPVERFIKCLNDRPAEIDPGRREHERNTNIRRASCDDGRRSEGPSAS